MNQAATYARVHPWIVIALAIMLVLLTVTAILLVVEPGLMHAIRAALHVTQLGSDSCPGSASSSC